MLLPSSTPDATFGRTCGKLFYPKALRPQIEPDIVVQPAVYALSCGFGFVNHVGTRTNDEPDKSREIPKFANRVEAKAGVTSNFVTKATPSSKCAAANSVGIYPWLVETESYEGKIGGASCRA